MTQMKKKNESVCELEKLPKTHTGICKLKLDVIVRSRVLRGVVCTVYSSTR